MSRGQVAASRTRATLAAAAPAKGMNYGPWTALEEHDCVEALIVHGAAFFEDDVVWTVAWMRCAWREIEKAIGTREIRQIQNYVKRFFAIGERLYTATSPAERRDIFTRKQADAIAALDAWRLNCAQVAAEEVEADAVSAYQRAAAAVATASDRAAARAERDALEEAAVNAYPDLFPVNARRPCPKSRATSPLDEKPT